MSTDWHDHDLATLRAERDQLRALLADHAACPQAPRRLPIPLRLQRQWVADVRARAAQQREQARGARGVEPGAGREEEA